MSKEEITIEIADQTGFTIRESDLSTGKIVVNGVEVTDTESWDKAISTFSDLEWQIKEKDKEIERLNKECDTYMKIATKKQTIIDELEKYIENGVKNSKMFPTAEMAYQLILDKLKELKGDNNGT